MKAGKKVMHFNFSDEEWMTINENGEIVFEDNVRCSQEEFWSHRTEESWNGGYIFYREPEMLEPAAPSQPAGEVWSVDGDKVRRGDNRELTFFCASYKDANHAATSLNTLENRVKELESQLKTKTA
jgi:hypothetical protein